MFRIIQTDSSSPLTSRADNKRAVLSSHKTLEVENFSNFQNLGMRDLTISRKKYKSCIKISRQV